MQLARTAPHLMRVQMPITRGASGAPILSERDEAIGVISEIPIIWTQELQRLVQSYAANGSGSGCSSAASIPLRRRLSSPGWCPNSNPPEPG